MARGPRCELACKVAFADGSVAGTLAGMRGGCLRWPVCAVALWALAGCARLLGIEDTELMPEPEPDPLVCADVVVPSELGAVALDTEAASDELAPSCGQAGAVDQTFAFTAPATDYYVFDTFDARFDTVLALYDRCEGTELACNNNIGALRQSELVRKLRVGEQALIAVEGYGGENGTGALKVSRVTCPDADLSERELPTELSTAGFGDDSQSTCGGAGYEDRAYHWVAPEEGVYAFRARGSGYAPAVSLSMGARCTDPSVGCNGAERGPDLAEVARFLRAGQEVSLTVDGADGGGVFSMDVVKRPGTCPAATLPAGLGLPAQQVGPRTLAPSCAAVERRGPFGGVFELQDKVYAFTAPKASPACFMSCEVMVRAEGPMALYALEGADCSGREVACLSTTFDAGAGKHQATLVLPGSDRAPTPYTVVAAALYPDSDLTYELSSFCLHSCP